MADAPKYLSNEERAERRYGKKTSTHFTPQGETGGPVNIPGRTNMGKPAELRSEATERAQAKNTAAKLGETSPAPLLQHLLSPNNAAMRDAGNKRMRDTVARTGGDDD